VYESAAAARPRDRHLALGRLRETSDVRGAAGGAKTNDQVTKSKTVLNQPTLTLDG